LSANLKEITENQADADRAIRDMATGLKSRQFDTLQALEYSARIMAFQGHESGLAGQITARTEEPGRYWTLRLGLGFEEASANGFIVVDDDNQCVRGQGMANPATRFHLWVYRARPDIQCIVHTHPPYVSALATLGAPLVIAHMDATPFFEDVAHLAQWPGVPVGNSEGEIIAAALGNDKHALMMSHHGMLTAGSTVAEATYLAVYMERAARMQLRAMSAGTMKPVEAHLARPAKELMRSASIVDASFDYWARQVDRAAR
jgi:L-fuculose-phosphate aldolase